MIILVTASFLFSFALYFLITNPIFEIEKEQQSLETLLSTLNSLALETTKLDKDPIDNQVKLIKERVVLLKEEFERIKNLDILPKTNVRIKASLGSIENLQSIIYLQIEDLENKASAILKTAGDLFGSGQGITILDFYDYHIQRSVSYDSFEPIHFNIKLLYSQIATVIKNIGYSVKTVEEQFTVIRDEIALIRVGSLVISIIIISVIISIAIIFSFIISSMLARSIQVIDKNILLLRSGDLTSRFEIKSKDDLGRLANNLNDFLGNLTAAIDEIKNVSIHNLNIKEDLLKVANLTSASLNEMVANIESMKKQVGVLDDRIHVSSSNSDNIFKSIDVLNNQLLEQNSMVEQTSSSVTEMISSIENVAKITDNRKSSIDHLVEIAGAGNNNLSETVSLINEINRSLDDVRGITEIIKKIAVQTNMLAMNAAIEAAHAGRYGHGFSVVAEEIRNLSEATGKQSKQISVNLKEVIQKILSASKSGAVTSDAFRKITNEINEVNHSFTEISNSMNELMTGGEQILKAMAHLMEISVHVKDASKEISDSSTATKDSMSSVNDISSSVRTNISEISTEIGDISEATNKASALTEKISQIIENLNNQVNRFKTKDDER